MSYYPHHQANIMESQDSEPPLDDGTYQQLVRDDSLLTRMGSGNLSSLIENPTSFHTGESRPQVMHQFILHQQPQQQEQQQPPPPPPTQTSSLVEEHHPVHTHSALMLNDAILPLPEGGFEASLLYDANWNNIDHLIDFPSEEISVTKAEVISAIEDTTTSATPDSSHNPQVPSIQEWRGQYGFKIGVPVGNKDKNKWCFSQMQNKLYLSKHVTVPIDVQLDHWLDGYVTITPVFKSSRHRVDHVVPCYNCSINDPEDFKKHIVRVEGQECEYTYKYADNRPVVSLPLHPPPPGEAASTLLIKLICLTSCNGGPNRRLFSLVFTLHDRSGTERGRQILEIKCCQCPSRDMNNEDSAMEKNQHPGQQNNNMNSANRPHVRKRTSSPAVANGGKKKKFNIKLEPGTIRRCENVLVPVEYVGKVKDYINGLIAKDFVRRNQPSLFPFSDEETV